MSSSRHPEEPIVRVGLLRVREHCTFSWHAPQSGRRTVEVRATHCEACVAELRARGYDIAVVDDGGK